MRSYLLIGFEHSTKSPSSFPYSFMTIEIISQFVIPILSCAGVYFVTKKDRTRKYGYVFGLCSQPFWIYTTAYNHQWGLFALSLFYTYRWIHGIVTHWKE